MQLIIMCQFRFTFFNRLSFLCLSVMAFSACSTYKTNSDISFESVNIQQKPEIFIGENDFESFRLDYLGWVEAKVSKPSIVHSKPTKEQADVVLARLGKDMGAQGVFFVTYNWDMLGNLNAKGQAVRIHGIDQLTTYKEKLKKRKEIEKAATIASFNDENNADSTIFLDVKDDPLVEAYMQANSIEDQIAEAGPEMTQLPKADVLVTLEQLRKIQTLAFKHQDIVIYEAISELLRNLEVYE